MLYLIQTSIPKKRQLHKSLLAIYGLGQPSANQVTASLGLLEEARSYHLRQKHLQNLKTLLQDYPRALGAELQNLQKACVQRLIDIQSYRGRRHKFAYPVRGQRRHTNAKTQKRLYRRWLINTYEKPKQVILRGKKPSLALKAKKPKVEKQKKKQKPSAQKAGKYKI